MHEEQKPMYQVKDWDKFFEGAKSRTYNNKTWCQMPNKQGLGYRMLIKKKNGAAIFGAWCALIQLLSKQEKPRQGYLTDTGRIPHGYHEDTTRILTAADLEMLTDIPASVFSEMLQVCASKEVGWLTDTTRIPHGYHADTTGSLHSDSDSDLVNNSDSDSLSKKPGVVNNPQPVENSEKKKLLDTWNEIATRTGRPQKIKITESLWKKYKARKSEGMEWKKVDAALSELSDFAKQGGWLTFDWIVENENNWIKLIEGKYKAVPMASKPSDCVNVLKSTPEQIQQAKRIAANSRFDEEIRP